MGISYILLFVPAPPPPSFGQEERGQGDLARLVIGGKDSFAEEFSEMAAIGGRKVAG
jgi:hypothetical protein